MPRKKKATQTPPLPIILSRNARKKRVGKGFSIAELKEASLSITEAKRLKLRIDKRRETLYKENVKALKAYLEAIKTS
ncbi:MAG: ribosomal protein L13e [Nitrososphaerales archaeon]